MVLRPDDGYVTDSLGWIHFRMGDSDSALKYLMKAHKMVPGESTILYHSGEVLLDRGDEGGALGYFRRALKAGEAKPKPDEEELELIRLRIRELK